MSVCGARQKRLYSNDSSSGRGTSEPAWEDRPQLHRGEAAQGIPNTSTGKSPALSPGNSMGLCLVMSSGQMRKCGEMGKDGGREGRGFHCQSRDFQLYLAGSGVCKWLVQEVLSETTFDGSVMGRLERLWNQTWDLYFCFTEI